jgi:hypothetical protein
MHQASILFTAAVMAMGGAWYALQDGALKKVETVVKEQPAVVVAHADLIANLLEE